MSNLWWLLAALLAGAIGLGAVCFRSPKPVENSPASPSVEACEDTSVEPSPQSTDVLMSDTIKAPEVDSPAVPIPDPVLTMLDAVQAAMGPPLKIPQGWSPPPLEEPKPDPTLPTLKQAGSPSDQLREAIHWFESLPRNKDSPQPPRVSKSKQGKTGIEPMVKECRQDFCRLSFTYTNWNSRPIPNESAKLGPTSWSFTTIAPDGRVQGHIFVVSPNHP